MTAKAPSELGLYLRHRALVWGVVLVAVLGALAWLAWRTGQVPDSPFTYRVQ